jgi:hypothetical protein
MSAFVVDKKHIDEIVTVALYGPQGTRISNWQFRWYFRHGNSTRLDYRRAEDVGGDAIGQMLIDENVASVTYRYDNCEDLPGPIEPYWNEPYIHDGYEAPRLSAIQAIKAIHCLDYHSCEHPGWNDSEAKALLDTLIQSLVFVLPGYDEARWEISA